MKRIFFLLFCLMPLFSSAQAFKKTAGGLELYSDSTLTTRVGTDVYEQCWCKAVYDSTNTLLYLKPKKNQRGYFAVQKNKLWGGIDSKGKTVHEFTFDGPFEQRKTGHYNVFHHLRDTLGTLQYMIGTTITRMDSTKKVDTSFFVMDEYKGSYLVSPDNVTFGIYSSDFKVLLPIKYEPIQYRMLNFRFNPSGLVSFENPAINKSGVVNYLGKTVVSFSYDWVNDYIWDDNFIFAQNDKKRGFVNSSNQIVVPLRYEMLPERLKDTNRVSDENYTWYVNSKFVAISPKYQDLSKEGDVFFFKKDGKWGVMDLTWKIIIPNVYGSIEYGPRLKTDPAFKCYYSVKNGKYGMMALDGTVIVPFEYECICGISYYAPDNYYIEFKKAGTLYRYDHTGKLFEKVAGAGKGCLCEMTAME